MDLCIVASRRPDLLAQTLDSFAEWIFPHVPIRGVVANVDPIFGGEDEHRRCVEVIRAHFPDARIFEPDAPGFGAAVRRLWSATSDDFVFHLEDDWRVLGRVGPGLLRPFDNPRVMQVSLHSAERNWDLKRKGPLHRGKRYSRALGFQLPIFSSYPKFTTSPSILRGDFARGCASRLDQCFDPEKQFYSGVNVDLERYVASFENYIYSEDGHPMIVDLGRPWAMARGIKKTTSHGVSRWTTGGSAPVT